MLPSRSAGRALVAFGSAGLVLLAAAALLAVVTLGSLAATASDLGRQRDQLAALVAPASASLRSSATAARNASSSLTLKRRCPKPVHRVLPESRTPKLRLRRNRELGSPQPTVT